MKQSRGSMTEVVDCGNGEIALHGAQFNRFVKMDGEHLMSSSLSQRDGRSRMLSHTALNAKLSRQIVQF